MKLSNGLRTMPSQKLPVSNLAFEIMLIERFGFETDVTLVARILSIESTTVGLSFIVEQEGYTVCVTIGADTELYKYLPTVRVGTEYIISGRIMKSDIANGYDLWAGFLVENPRS